MDSWFLFFSFPAKLIVESRVQKQAKNPAGEVLRLIQIRVVMPSLKKSRLLVKAIRRKQASLIRVP